IRSERVDRLLRDQRRRATVSALAVAATVVLVSGILLWRWLMPASRVPTVSVEVTQGSVVSSSGGATSEMQMGDRIRVAIGVARLNLPGGGTVLLEGPADLLVNGPGDLGLEEGKAVFDVSAADAKSGFIVRSPNGTYLDLGTTFGVTTSPK